jgi:hypothetical protein
VYHGTDAGLFGLLELPFLFIAVFFAFRVAAKLRGGAFGAGMLYLAWGFLVMAIGHLLMQVERYTQINPLTSIFGPYGDILWVIALMITWTLSAYGFLKIYRAASG